MSKRHIDRTQEDIIRMKIDFKGVLRKQKLDYEEKAILLKFNPSYLFTRS